MCPYPCANLAVVEGVRLRIAKACVTLRSRKGQNHIGLTDMLRTVAWSPSLSVESIVPRTPIDAGQGVLRRTSTCPLSSPALMAT